jgi:hypothetical protein
LNNEGIVMIEKVWFTLENANDIVGYLGTRPYQEVYQLMAMIQKAVDVQQAQALAQQAQSAAEEPQP